MRIRLESVIWFSATCKKHAKPHAINTKKQLKVDTRITRNTTTLKLVRSHILFKKKSTSFKTWKLFLKRCLLSCLCHVMPLFPSVLSYYWMQLPNCNTCNHWFCFIFRDVTCPYEFGLASILCLNSNPQWTNDNSYKY